MTLENQLLEKLANWRPDNQSSPLVVEDHTSGWRVHLQVDTADTLSVRLNSLEVRRVHPLADATPLTQRAERLAAFTGLLEPLKLIEVDRDRGIAQLRSAAPASQGAALRYFELLRHEDGTTLLQRYETGSGPRQAIAFTLTHETLLKAIGELTA